MQQIQQVQEVKPISLKKNEQIQPHLSPVQQTIPQEKPSSFKNQWSNYNKNDFKPKNSPQPNTKPEKEKEKMSFKDQILNKAKSNFKAEKQMKFEWF